MGLAGQFKVIRAVNVSGANIILYKHPSSVTSLGSVRGYHQVVTFDDQNNEVEKYTYRHVRRLQDANRIFNYVLSLARG